MKIPLILEAFNSPFIRPKFKLYFGKIAIGIPIFLPRRWVKATSERANKAVIKYLYQEINYNALNPENNRKIKCYEDIFKDKMKHLYCVPLKIGFSFCDICWKTKWSNIDYRYEYGSCLSFVAFGYQFAINFIAPEESHYWECFLAYYYETDKTKSWRERIDDVRLRFPCVWNTYRDGEKKETIDFYTKILKKKYLK